MSLHYVYKAIEAIFFVFKDVEKQSHDEVHALTVAYGRIVVSVGIQNVVKRILTLKMVKLEVFIA